MKQAILVVVIMIYQFHDRIEFGAFLNGNAISHVGADSVMSAASLKRNGQCRRLFVGVLHRDADEEESVAVTKAGHPLFRFQPGDHVMIPRHFFVKAPDDRKLERRSLGADILQQGSAGEVESSRFPADGLLQVFDGEVLED